MTVVFILNALVVAVLAVCDLDCGILFRLFDDDYYVLIVLWNCIGLVFMLWFGEADVGGWFIGLDFGFMLICLVFVYFKLLF